MYTLTALLAAALLLANSVSSAPAARVPSSNSTNIATASPSSSFAAPSLTSSPSTAAIVPPTATATATPNTSTSPTSLTLFQQLVLAPNAASRINLLTDDDFIFNFNNPDLTAGVVKGKGGFTVRADHSTFPALVGSGGSITMGFLGPCGFNTPHVHPRAAELNVVVQGRLFASVTAENGARHMNHTLNKYEMTVFPQGAVHTEYNPDCTPAVFVAAFPSEDPGVGQIAQEYFGLEDQIVRNSAGGAVTVDGKDLELFRSLIPANVAQIVDSCLAKCGIEKRSVK